MILRVAVYAAVSALLLSGCGNAADDTGKRGDDQNTVPDSAPSQIVEDAALDSPSSEPRTIKQANAQMREASERLAALERETSGLPPTRILPSGLEVSLEVVNVSNHWRDDKTNMALVCSGSVYTVDDLELTLAEDPTVPTALTFQVTWSGDASCQRKVNVSSTYDARPADAALPTQISVTAPSPTEQSTTPGGIIHATYSADIAGKEKTGNSVMRCSINSKDTRIPPGRTGFHLRCANIDFADLIDFSSVPGRNHSAGMSIGLMVLQG